MGVPNFYSWLVKRYPMAQYDFNNSLNQKTDFLFLDMNQVVYKCATNQNTIFKDHLKQRDLEDVWIAIFSYLNRLIDLVDPQQFLFIAFDGGSPRAKLNQQRQRRFQSAKHNQKIEQQFVDLGFQHENDSYKNNQITSGTEFMEQLNQQIQFYIKRKFAEDKRWQKLKVLYSGCDVPGEGEHKLMDFIRNLKKSPNFCPDWSFMVYGADADLIMLGLTTHLKYFNILREKMPPYDFQKISVATQRGQDKLGFQLMNLQIIREYMDLEYKDLNYKKPYDINRIIDDFLMICIFVGNDFLPRVFCFDIRQGTLDLLILLFKQAEQESFDYINDQGKINWKEMLIMLKLLSDFEIVAIEQKSKELQQILVDKFTNDKKLVNQELDIIKQLTTAYKSGNITKAKQKYYMGKFQIDYENNIQDIKSIIINYLDGIQFVLKYYYLGLPSWEWHYHYYYSPLCSEIFQYVLENIETMSACIFEHNSPPDNSYFQLMCKIPASNSNLLPLPYRSLLLDPESPLKKPINYFPIEFEVDPFGAVYDHQYIVKIPFLNMSYMRTVFDSIDTSLLTEEEKIRQVNGQTKIFQYDESQVFVFLSQKNYVKSLLPSIYQDFEVRIQIKSFDFNNLDQCINLSKSFTHLNNQMLRGPSIRIIKLNNYSLIDIKDPERKALTITHEITENQTIINLLQTQQSTVNIFKLELWVYAGYPVQFQCLVLAVLTPINIFLAKDYSIEQISRLQDLEYDQNNHQESFDLLKSNLSGCLKSKGISSENISTIVIVIQYMSKSRRSNGSIGLSDGQEFVLPLQQIFYEKQYDFQCNQIIAQHLFQEFAQCTNVLLFTPQKGNMKSINGSICKVQLTIPTSQKLVLKIIKKTPIIKIETYLNNVPYYDVNFVASELGLPLEVLLYVMGSVIIVHKKNSSQLSDGVDVGLNIIDMRYNFLVPELARMPKANSSALGVQRQNQFQKNLKLSTECVKLIVQYKKIFPQLFIFLKDMSEKLIQRINFIQIDQIYKEQDEPQKKLYQVYIWVLQHPSSQYQQSKAATAVVTQIDVIKMGQQIHTSQNQDFCEILVNAGYIIKEQSDFYIPPFYSSHPRLHELGSRVINLNSTSSLKAKFGATGTVIGLYEQNELLIEVLWDEPQIGFAMQSGRQPALRISVVKFNDVMNLSFNWSDLLVDRDCNIEGWNNQVSTYSPFFRTKAIDNQNIHCQILKIKNLVDPFFCQFVEDTKD